MEWLTVPVVMAGCKLSSMRLYLMLRRKAMRSCVPYRGAAMFRSRGLQAVAQPFRRILRATEPMIAQLVRAIKLVNVSR